jgi:hypothetical protein
MTRAALLAAAFCLSAGSTLVGCDEDDLSSGVEVQEGDIVVEDTGFEDPVVTLTDDDGATLESSIEVAEVEVATGVDVLLDWSRLTQDLWGNPLDPLADAQRASLYHFNMDDLDAVIDGILHGTLYQSVLDLQVTCRSETASCHMSEFSFMLGHAVDVVDMFEQADGIWLLAVQSNDGQQDLAYLALVPVPGAGAETAEVSDASSTGHLDADMHDLPVVTVAHDGQMVVDWSALTRDCFGDQLDPRLIDSLKLARVPEDLLDDPQQVIVHLGEVAEELWVASVPNSQSSFPLADVQRAETGARGFQGPDGPDAWLLTLSCAGCGDLLPRYLTRVTWDDTQ